MVQYKRDKKQARKNYMVVRVNQIPSLAINFTQYLLKLTRVGVTMTFLDASSPKLSPDFCPHSHCHICERCALPIMTTQDTKLHTFEGTEDRPRHAQFRFRRTNACRQE